MQFGSDLGTTLVIVVLAVIAIILLSIRIAMRNTMQRHHFVRSAFDEEWPDGGIGLDDAEPTHRPDNYFDPSDPAGGTGGAFDSGGGSTE